MWPTTAQGWLTLAATALGLIGTISAMVHSLLKKYKTTLEEATHLLIDQKEAIEESVSDRGEIRKQLNHLVTAQQTQMRLEIDKIAERALTRGCITSREWSQLKPLWDAYDGNGWNHIQRGQVEAALKLPVENERN